MDERPGFSEYLRALANTTACGGLTVHLQQAQGLATHERTVYRWHQVLGDQLVTYPGITTESLGLSNAFIFTPNHQTTTRALPYAVMTARATPNCATTEYFVHAIVPDEHRSAVQAIVEQDPGAHLWWGNTGWEHYAFANQPLLPARWNASDARDLVRHEPFVVPVIFEHWGRRHSLTSLWHAINQRLGTDLNKYLGRHHYTTNGKTHVAAAYRALNNAGVFRQQIIRYLPSHLDALNVVVIARWNDSTLHGFLNTVSAQASLVCTHPLEGAWLIHLIGKTPLVHTVMDARPDHVYFLRDPSIERWRYEELFDPTARAWLLPASLRSTRGEA